jgi:LCP family protein required for cell wall assembly
VPANDPQAPRRRRTPTAILVTRIVAAVLAGAMLIVAGAGWAFTGALQSNSGTSDAANNAGSGGVISADGMTILLVGSDARTDADGNPLSADELAQVGTEDDGGGINTDTIMLVHIPQGGGKATAVSLPRDTWIGTKVINQVAGPYADGTEGQYSPNKINSYYSTAKAYTEQYLVKQGVTDKAQIERESNEAGRTMLIRVVQAFTGMKVDHYAEVNLLGFYLLSNAIGGIPVCLNAAVNDPWSGADFPAGPQEVSGTAALAFVRQRHGLPEGDLDRVRRQQAFLSGAADKILSVGTLTDPSKLSDLVDAINRSVTFDKGFSVLTFAEQITNLSSGNISFETLPTTGPESSTDKDALATDPAALKTFFAGITSGTTSSAAAPAAQAPVDPSSITVDVQDGTIADGVTSFAAETINKAGFVLGSLGVVPGTKAGKETSTTAVHYPADASGMAQQVADAFGTGQLVEDDAIKSGHVLLVVGTDLDTTGTPTAAAAPATAAPATGDSGAAAPATTNAATAGSVRCVN